MDWVQTLVGAASVVVPILMHSNRQHRENTTRLDQFETKIEPLWDLTKELVKKGFKS